ncbi:hypothetical protein WH43_00300 [Rheinheimera sp. KL1]|uniref:phage tail protein n=1 Tax=Rheinheimera sp. KL1 TaxID=1635005 RepID=UPI0006A9CDBE|nr:tail fiber protein [Rheinheimera sp. KL1]KOO60099.1 hypothetical protein WH43_00300 [Rheinheimera sp. KL1]
MDADLGLVVDFAFAWAPRNWLACNGQLVQISQNNALYSLLGVVYGGDGRATFGVPDLRGRSRMGQGLGPGLTSNRVVGQTFGTEGHTLTLAEMPIHNHAATFTPTGGSAGQPLTATLKAAVVDATSSSPAAGAYLATAAVNATSGPQDKPEYIYYSGAAPAQTFDLAGLTVSGGGGGITGGTVAVGNNGGSTAFSIIPPTQVLNPCICSAGLYPTRN